MCGYIYLHIHRSCFLIKNIDSRSGRVVDGGGGGEDEKKLSSVVWNVLPRIAFVRIPVNQQHQFSVIQYVFCGRVYHE